MIALIFSTVRLRIQLVIDTGYNKQKVNVHNRNNNGVPDKQDHKQTEISSDKILRNHQKTCMEIPLLPGYAGIA